MNTDNVRLTQFAHGAGCGCKIAPQVLKEIIGSGSSQAHDKRLLVGNDENDDAAAYDIGNDQVLIATTDFFMPIVDDAFDFGRVAAANAISDVYAMGGRPLLALAVLGWPVDKLPPALAAKVLEGARAVCSEAGIVLAGGHSIDSPEPIFGLSVNGLTTRDNLKRNSTASEGDLIFMTKPLGVGIMSTAQKRGVLLEEHQSILITQLTQLNKLGESLGKLKGVSAMTDITGFGLLGHLCEMAEGSGLTAEIEFAKIPVIAGVTDYIQKGITPDATYRNWNAYSKKTKIEDTVDAMGSFMLLPDPQTNGGLLFTVAEKDLVQIQGLSDSATLIGKMLPATGIAVHVK